MIKLVIEPGVKKTWEQFLAENPPFSIGIDGYVNAPPLLSEKGPHLNLDHHEGVDRLATYSTCKQMMLAINGRLFRTFQKDGVPTATLFGNDCDQDVWVVDATINHHERFVGAKSEPRLRQLIDVVDLLDTTGGLYLMDINSRLRKEVNWIFHPYTEARTSGTLEKMTGEEMVNLVKLGGRRIIDYANGRGGQIEPDTRHKIRHKGNGWVMFEEIGADARYKVCMEGDGAYVMIKEGGSSSRFHYSVGRISKFVPFPVREIINALNAVEGPTVVMEKTHRPTWGGSDIIGGSPRVFGSCLTPEEVIKIVEEVLAKTGPA
ncbi:MAG: hypothetical protein Q7S83_00720 [bacterium]|nr:hypothetical protein [bacterium]